MSYYKDIKVAVVGDVMLDHYIFSRPIKVSTEAPVLIVRKQAIMNVLGGAANVAANIRKLGAQVIVVGVIGNDYFGKKLRDLVDELQIQSGLVVDKRPTTTKMRILAHSQQIVRLDTEVEANLKSHIRDSLIEKVKKFNPDVIVISDYLKGVISIELLDELKKLGKLIVSNLKPQNIFSCRNTDTTILNRHEAYQALKSIQNKNLDLSGLRGLLDVKYLIETKGSEGLTIYSSKDRIDNKAERVKVYDVCGAGDTVISVVALERFLGTDIEKIGLLANYGASTVVKQLGTHSIDKEDFFRFRKQLLKE
jgi:rfaE bifunctional protein kinase chain/domain